MKWRDYLADIILSLTAVASIGFAAACIVATVSHVLFSDVNMPTPFLATWRANLTALTVLVASVVSAVIRLVFVGRKAVEAYHQSTDEEKIFLRRIAVAIFNRVRQTNGTWGQVAKAAEEFCREVKL